MVVHGKILLRPHFGEAAILMPQMILSADHFSICSNEAEAEVMRQTYQIAKAWGTGVLRDVEPVLELVGGSSL